MTTVTIILAVVCACIAVTTWLGNTQRLANRVSGLLWLTLTTWFTLVYQAIRAEDAIASGQPADVITWLRANSLVAAFFPSLLWLLKEVIINDDDRLRTPLRRSLPALLVSAAAATLCYTETFVEVAETFVGHRRGLPYFAFIILLIILHTWLVVDLLIQTRRSTGIRRVELQFLALSIGVGFVLGTACVGIGNLLENIFIRRASLFVFLSGYVVTAWALTAHRIFNARQVGLLLLHRFLVILTLSAIALGVLTILKPATGSVTASLLAITVGSLCAYWVDQSTRNWLKLDGKQELAAWRKEVLSKSYNIVDSTELVAEFERLVMERCCCRGASLIFDRASATSLPSELQDNHAAYSYLCQASWATPESLRRRRASAGLAELRQFLVRNGIGLILTAPRGSRAPSLILTAGIRDNAAPFTYPEIERLQNVAELMDNIITRSRLTAQAALHARMEHLAMMSRGLAHDLKNLITPVSSFLVHTDSRFAPETVEGEVHAAAQRSVRIMSDYVREALFFAERLAPKFERVDLSRLCETVRDITAERARRRNVALDLPRQFHSPIIADDVLLQRMLGNLVANAIDASSPGGIVTLSIACTRRDFVQFKIVDRGCGIAPDHLGRIFDAYFTTKEFGDNARGFGLGLTISRKIADLHRGSIHVESQLGVGTTFTVDLPIAQAIGGTTPAVDASPDATMRTAVGLT